MAKTLLLPLCFLLLILSAEALKSLPGNIRYSRDTKYVYAFDSNSIFDENMQMTLTCEVVIYVQSETDIWQDLHITINSPTVTWITEKGEFNDNGYFADIKSQTNWFTVRQMSDTMHIDSISYPAAHVGEYTQTVLKKSVANMLSVGNHTQKSSHASGILIKSSDFQLQSGFEKKIKKETSIGRNGEVLNVNVTEVLSAKDDKSNKLFHAEIFSHTNLALQKQVPSFNLPQDSSIDLITESLFDIASTVPDQIFDDTKLLYSKVIELLKCAANNEVCKQDILKIMKTLKDEDLSNLVINIFELTRSSSTSTDETITFLDIISKLSLSMKVSDVIVELVFKEDIPENVIKKVLSLYTTTSLVPTEKSVTMLMSYVTSDDVSKDIQERILLALGSISRNIRNINSTVSSNIAEFLNNILTGHISGKTSQTYRLSSLIHSIGNAAHDTSIDTIKSALSTDGLINTEAQLAGIRALSKYPFNEVASTLDTIAQTTSHPQVQHASVSTYMKFPNRTKDLTHILKRSIRSKRDSTAIMEAPKYNVTMPVVNWGLSFGDDNISVDITRNVMNSFDIVNDPFSSKYLISIRDESEFSSSLSLSSGQQENKFLQTELCLEGTITYSTNIETSYHHMELSTQFTDFQEIVEDLIVQFEAAYEAIVESKALFTDLASDFSSGLTSTNTKLQEASSYLEQFEADSNGIEDYSGLKSQALELAMHINNSYITANHEFKKSQQNLIDLLDTILSGKLEEFFTALLKDSQPFTTQSELVPYMRYAPQTALTGIYEVYWKSGNVLDELETSVNNFIKLTSKYGPNSNWTNPYFTLWSVENSIDELIIDIELEEEHAVDTGADVSNFQALSKTISDNLKPSLNSLVSSSSAVHSTVSSLSSALDNVQSGYDKFTQSYERARSTVDRIFGQRFYPGFPNEIRPCTEDLECGTYPSTSGDLFKSGIDLLWSTDNGPILAPYSGYISLYSFSNSSYNYTQNNSIIVTPTDFSMDSIHFVISNIEPHHAISNTPSFVKAGEIIGAAKPFSSVYDGIHVEAYKTLASVTYNINPTQFVAPVLKPTANVDWDCNEITTIVNGMVVETQDFISTKPKMELIGDPLISIDIDDEEFPQPYDLILERKSELSSTESVEFFQSSTFLMVGVVPVTFAFRSYGQYSVNASIHAALLSRNMDIEVTPEVWGKVQGSMRVGDAIYALVDIDGSLLNVSLPMMINQNGGSWPLSAGSNMDLILHPTSLNLTTKLMQRVGTGDLASEVELESHVRWSYSIPDVELEDEFDYVNTYNDLTPPVFLPLEYSNDSLCHIRQLSERDFYNPAFELEFSTNEAEGLSNVQVLIGTQENLGNALSTTVMHGERLVLPSSLSDEKDTVVTIIATNRDGLQSTANCKLTNYDLSPPQARIVPYSKITSHPDKFEVLLALFDEYGLGDYAELGVGTVAGVDGSDIMDWIKLDTSIINQNKEEFSFPRSGRLIENVLSVSNEENSNDECKSLCLHEPNCLSYDYSESQKRCILHSSIEGPPSSDGYLNTFETLTIKALDDFVHHEALGRGNSTVYKFSDLSLEHGQEFYINLVLHNKLGFSNVISSSSIMVDLTPPTPGRVRNTNETLVMEKCGESFNILHKCEGETTTVSNHRVIYDGSGSHTVFNGPTPFLDALYTKANSFISANWDGVEDRESGLFAYTWCISSNTNYTCDVFGPANPHGSNSEQVYWTNTGLATFSDDELEDGDYYITVDAINNAVYGGAMVTTIHHTTPYILDTTPPIVQHLTIINYDTFNNILTLNISVSDFGSGIKEVAISVGTTIDNTEILNWSPVDKTHIIVNVSVIIPDGVTGWVKARAINNVDLQSIHTSSLPINVDRTPPTSGQLYDGSVKGVDAMYQSDNAEICLNWEGIVDTHSGIISLKWGVGTSPGTYDLLPLQNVTDEEAAGHLVCAASVTLSDGVSYYSTLIATNGADLTTTISSNGVKIDTTGPTAGVVRDGSSVDIKYSHSLTTLEANWDQFSDIESGITKYTVTVYQMMSGSDTATAVLTKSNIETNSYYGNHFHFSNGDIISVKVTAFNGADLSVSSSSDGYTIDLTAPEVMTLSDGPSSMSDLDYFSNSSYSFNWVAFDYESNVSSIELTLYRLTGGKKTRVYPVLEQTYVLDDLSLTKYTIDDIEFTHGMKYKAKLMLTNGAGLKSSFETDGAIGDFIPPTMESAVVYGDTILYSDVLDGVLQLGNNREVDASWHGSDDGSGIMEFIVCVVDATNNVPSGCNTFDQGSVSGTVSSLNLTMGTEDTGPFYKVQVTAIDYVGLQSQPIYSDIFWVSGEEHSGTVYDGFSPLEDIDYTYEMSSISTYFSGFISHQCGGIVGYQWAIGQNNDDKTSVMSFTDYGLTITGNGSGYAQLPLNLNDHQSEELYITVQGVTGCGDVMESTSNGFVIDSTPPFINIVETSHQAIENKSSSNVYQTQTMFSSIWKTMEDSYDSSTDDVTVSIGSYPGGMDFINETKINGDHIRESIVAANGVPSYVTVSIKNKAGLQSIEYSSAVVLDTSPPEIEFLTCSMFSGSIISCDWNVHDAESGIDYVLLSLSLDSTDKSRITHTQLLGSSCSVTFNVSEHSTEQPFYGVLYAYNNVELETIMSSSAIYIDTTPPINDGMVHVIPNFGEQNYTDDSAEHSQAPSTAVCIWVTDVIQLKFPISYDDDSKVTEYRLAIGWTPSDESVVAFHQVTVEIKDDEWAYYDVHVFNVINSFSRRPYYFTIRSFNDIGLYSDIASAPVYFKSDETSLPSWVYDGDSKSKDREYQAFTNIFDGNAFFGVNCPMKLVEWSIEGSDGIVIKSFMEIDVNDYENNSYSFSTDQVTYENETYRITVRGIDYSGQTHVIKSNGLIVTKRQLSPGIVREGVQGLLPLSYQESLTSLPFYFEGFGDGTDEQEIEYFEVALGSDKEHVHTKSDIVPFTNIGLARSHEFVNLDLISQTQTYYTTVRAHAVSGATAEASSNGIVVGLTHTIMPGKIHQTEFQHNTSYLSAYWDGFESNVHITKYEWALGSVVHSNSYLQSMCENRTNRHEFDFDVFGFVDLETNTYGYADELSLKHGAKYYVTIRVTDEADMCITVISQVPTVVDVTPPITNDITVGVEESRLNLPIEDEYIAYLIHDSSLTVSWKNFMDAESGIKSYQIGIFRLKECSSSNLEDSGVVIEYIDVGLKNEFTFENIDLDSNISYATKIKATNNAGLTVIANSNPILVDVYELSAGQVKDGTDWREDLVFQSDRTKLGGVLALAYNKPDIEMTTPCPSNRFYSFMNLSEDWSSTPFTEFNGLKSSALEYEDSKIEINETGLTITASFQPSVKKVLSGMYHSFLSAFSERESISLMVRPVQGDPSLVNYTVTSVLILESSDDQLLVEYDPTVVSESSSEYKALGLQIHSQNGTDQHKLILWSKESKIHSKTKTATKETVLNSSISHKVDLDFYYEMHGLHMKTKVEVRIDDILTLVLHDIPQFDTGARFILHLFNREGYIPYCDFGCINPPAVIASFHDISLPTELGEVCQYGTPFYSWGSPIVQIKGGIGTSTTLADIKPLEVVHAPCRSCANPSTPCYSYGCDKTCPPSDPHTVSFSFSHTSLQSVSDNNTLLDSSGSGSGDEQQHSDVIGYFETFLQPTVYYIIIEATTASGQSIRTTSNGVLIDITPPIQSVPIHLYDVEFSLTQSSKYQGNNHTISATWGFRDLESGIVNYEWSIGRTPYGREVQEYVSVGMQTHATNSSLQGLLLHNETYYVTVKAINGVWLSSVVTSSGITHLSIELNETELNNGIIVTSSKVVLDISNRSLYIVSAEENIGVVITTNVEDVDITSWGLGSHIEQSYDIFPLTAIGQGVTASVDHKLLYVDNMPHGNISDILALSDGVDPSEISGLFIEPGRVFYHTVEFCDLAHSCITSSPRQAMFLRSYDITTISHKGEDLNFTMTQLSPVPDTNTTLNVTTLDSNHTVSITTTGGLQKGTWLFAGFLGEEDVTLEYHVDIPYISNPYLTMDQTSRELARRFSAIGGPSFFVSFFGQESLYGEMVVSTTFNKLLNWNTSVPRLAYWDIDNNEWREVEDTCGSQTAINWTTYTLSVEVCSTVVDGVDISSRPSSLSRRRRNIDLESSGSGNIEQENFLERPVQFIVIERGNVSSNTPPKLVIESPVVLTEDVTFTYQIQYEDAEDDDVLFYITSVPKLGVASVDSDTGMLTYTPCKNCIGYDTLEIYIQETNLKFGRELSATGLLQLHISNANDPLMSFLFDNTSSNGVWPSNSIKVYVEANRTEPVTIAKVGSYDFDGYEDDIEVYVTGASSGSRGYITWLDAVAVPESLPVNWALDIASFNGYIAFLGVDITYMPDDPEYTGEDDVYIYAQQEDTITSASLHIEIEVIPSVCLNNGVCNGSSADPDCTDIENRKTNPAEYKCKCPDGYSGSYCQYNDTVEKVESEPACPGSIPEVDCGGNPCDGAVCPGYDDTDAVCIPDYCGHCHAVWYLDNEVIRCSASKEGACFKPRTAGLTFCNGVSCDCPSEPYECPEDSVYVETRVDDCCVQYSCVCPDISCPLLMDSSKNVYPQPEYRGGQYPGRCCPNYAFTDINECEDPRLHMCSDDCINTDLSYSCGCEDGATLASNGRTCGVCNYDGAQYLYGDKVEIGCNWCTCQADSLSGERWHCTAQTCDPNCYYNGTTYSVNSQLALTSASCSCEATDTFAEWICQSDI